MKRSFGLILLAAAMTTGCATSTMTAAVVTKTSTSGPARPASPSAPAPSTVTGHPLLGLENNTNEDRQILAIASLPWKPR